MENRVENPGLNIDRGRVDSFKKVIKEKEVFKLEGSDRDLAAIGVIGELGINGVNTTEDLFDKTQNGNVNQEVARKNIKDLGTAIAESILESDNEELKAAMVAGSYSTEALLPEPWRGRMESDDGDVGLAGVICDALTDKISDKTKKETVQRAMETVDFFKNNSEYSNLLVDQLDSSIVELRGLINPLNRNEMKVISERLKYLQDEKDKTNSKSPKVVFGQEKSKTDKDRRLAQIERAEAMKSQEEASENGAEGEKRKGSFYMMEPEDLVNLEMSQRAKDQFHFSPPYPEWFKELPSKDQKLWIVRNKLINGVAYKQALRNVDAEKLMMNRGLDINKGELKLLCEMPKFQESMHAMFEDLFVLGNEGGEQFLRLRRGSTEEGKFGSPLDTKVDYILTHFEAYKEKLALKMQYPGKTEDEINKMYLNEERANDSIRGSVATAWNFLYIGNIIESADVDRQLKPTEVVSDKLRTMIHPLQKALGKWGVYKEGKSMQDLDGVTGEEEPMGGAIATWVQYHLDLDTVKGKHDFRQKLANREIRPLPERMACSFVEMFEVTTEDGVKMPMSEAIRTNKKIIFNENDIENDLDIFTDFRDSMDGCKTAFDYLSGNKKLELGKNHEEWARGFQKDIALIRQTKVEAVADKRKYLSFLNDPEFMKWVIAASMGFETKADDVLLTLKSYRNYNGAVREIVGLPGLIKLENRNTVLKMLGGDKGDVATNIMINKIQNQVTNNERDLYRWLKKRR